MGVIVWVLLAAHALVEASGGYDCGYKTVWLDKTEYRPVPQYVGG